jgi:signal transduction histidine kinase
MTLRRRQLMLGAVVALLCAAVTFVPFRMWDRQRVERIEAEISSELSYQMEEVLYREITGTRSAEWPIAYYVDIWDQYIEPFGEYDLEPPLLTWVRDAAGRVNEREFELDNSTGLRGLIRPINEGQAYVTLAYTGGRDEALGNQRSRRLRIAIGLAALCAALGVLASVLATRPLRRLMGDRQAFLADAAHEMRTPLAVIMASSSQALSRSRSSEEYVRSLSEIRSAAERASTGVNEMLDLVRFETGQAIPRTAPLRLDLLAEEVAASIRPDDVEIVAEPCDPVVVAGDMALLRQAVENIVRNAARRASRVELRSRSDRNTGTIDVIDDGPGFDPVVLPRVFERYQRGDRKGEAGIGLAIVKAIVTAHGGTVEARNNDGAPGAIVSLSIPLSRQ